MLFEKVKILLIFVVSWLSGEGLKGGVSIVSYKLDFFFHNGCRKPLQYRFHQLLCSVVRMASLKIARAAGA